MRLSAALLARATSPRARAAADPPAAFLTFPPTFPSNSAPPFYITAFFPNIDGSLSLTPNVWTWTQNANVIFIEQPAGVGFSWSATPADYTVGDAQAAEDVYQFLLGFTARYPKYAGRPLYLSGESYGGHYIPTEAAAVVRGNAAGGNPRLNLQGFFVGNAWT